MEVTTPASSSYGHQFTWTDYTFFGGMLAMSTIIGIYFGFFGKKQNTASEYLMGGKRMHAIPIAASQVACQISATTLLAVPADIYKFGANYMWLSVSTLLVSIAVYKIYLPVFYNLQLTSIYEYLQMRFDRKMRILSSFLTIVSMLVFCPVAIYIPSLAFAQVSGVNVMLVASVTSIICVFYTTVGGLKAVVWTDTFQFVVMVITFSIVFVMGLSSVGGFASVVDRSIAGRRFEVLDFSFDPTLRDSFSALIIGGTAQWIAFTGTNQAVLQKYLSVPTFKDARSALVIYTICISIIHVFAVFMGLLVYAKYWNCDPLASNQISRIEQLLPHFVMEVAGSLPGLPGVFIAGVFSAGLSSLSACLNAISGVIYEDFVSHFLSKSTSQQRISNVLKVIVAGMGIVCTLLVFILDNVKGIFPFYIGLMAVATGPLLGIFTMGLLVPFVNSKGAFYGGIFSMIVIGWIALQNQWYQSHGLNDEFLKPISTDGCYNSSFDISNTSQVERPIFLYRISFWFYALIGAVVSMACGFVISCFTGHDKAPVPKKLLSPIVHGFLSRASSKDSVEPEKIPLNSF
ncbi:sodium-coupled monocarboxylate transporter 2-like isoform X1 [Photinus pyralis]|nr:sodium-coupled monocarboxylate transporter 2-like isoform X1 [Photinus pyralis]